MRISNRDMAILVIILIFLSLANIFPVKMKVIGRATDQAAATISVNVITSPPIILYYYPLIDVTITEEQNQTFRITFTDNDPSVIITWILDEDIVEQEEKTVPEVSNYTFISNYSSAGYYTLTVLVSDEYYSTSHTWSLDVINVNRPPYFHTIIPDMSWNQGSTYTMESLDNYAEDPDLAIDDTLSYEILFVSEPPQIQATIDPITREVLFRAVPTFIGSEVVYFEVIDSEGAFNYSNNVTLTVKEPTISELARPPSGRGGGGGGGGRSYEEKCENYWYCGAWGPCDPITNTRERECIDLAGCPVARNKPKEIENCTYIPTCYDGIKNGDELGVDCGGSCPSCWTCYDGIKNQGEEGIDCGGPCQPCATCNDSKRNCQRLDKETVLCEDGVDCGGACPLDCCKNNYWDDNLGEEGIDCGGDCKACELLAPISIKRIALLLTTTLIAFIATFVLLIKKYKKKKILGVIEGIAIKDLKRIEIGLNKLEKIIDSAPNKKIIKLLSYIAVRIIHYRFNVDLSCTEKELLEKLSKIKRDKNIKNKLAYIHSRLYHLKFSGEEIPKEELLQFIKELKIINSLTIEELYSKQKKEEGKVISLKKKKIKTKHKVIPLIFVVLTLTMVFSLILMQQPKIPESAPLSGFAVYEEDKPGQEPITGMAVSDVKERSLLTRFVDWLIKAVRTVGKPTETCPDPDPEFIYPIDQQIFQIQEDSDFSTSIEGSDSSEGCYPLTFSFLEEEVNKKFIFQLIPHEITMIDDTTSEISFTPTEEYVYDSNKIKGNYTVTIVVKDNTEEVSKSISVMFNITNINDAPDIPDYSPELEASVDENSSITFWFDNETADPDLIHPGYDYITHQWYFNGEENSTNVSWTYYPGFCDSGEYEVSLNVTDSYGLSGSLTWELTVENVVRPPTLIKSFEDYKYKEWVEGSSVSDYLTLEEFFEDSDAIECFEPTDITYGYETVSVDSVDSSELSVLIDEVTSNVSFNPSTDWFGVQVIRFYADNGAKTYSDVDITLNVTNVNDAPVLQDIPDQYLDLGVPYIYDVNATDPDNDVLYFSDNATIFDIDESTGIINFTPETEGTYAINISVSDGEFEDSRIVSFMIYVENYPPNITMIYPYGTPLSDTTVYAFESTTLFPGDITSINATENTTMLFNHVSSDIEGEDLTCKWYLDGDLEESNDCEDVPYWNYEIDFLQDGVRNVTLIVEDAKKKDTFTWNVSVKNVNQAPTFGEKILTSYEDFDSSNLNQTDITTEQGNITLEKTGSQLYYEDGTYISPVIDLKGHYARTNIKSINWEESKPEGTNITFRVRISNTTAAISSADWSDIYYDGSGDNIIDSSGRYIQFKINMTTDDNSITPKVEKVIINYEIKDSEITGSYQSWIDLDNFFDDKDGITTLDYTYEYISGSSLMELSIESETNVVSLFPTASGVVIFRFVANDSYSAAYSNNITLDVDLEEPSPTVITVPTSSGGGGGGARKTKIVPVPETSYQQLVYIEPLQVSLNQTIIAPVILKNTGDNALSDIYLSAKTDMEGISFKFERDYISTIGINENIKTNLYIQADHPIDVPYSVDVIAKVTYPDLEDISTININPLENITQKINLVRDLLQLHPVCRELEEVVVQAQEALNNNRDEEADNLLTEVIEGCKYLVSASQEQELKSPFVLKRKSIYIALGILILLLLLAYFVPRIINRIKIKKQKRR